MSISIAKLNKKQVVEVYSQVASLYDIWGALAETKARQRALARAAIRDGGAVLEVAVGTGLTFQAILKANPHGHNAGIDLTPAMLEKARARGRNPASAATIFQSGTPTPSASPTANSTC